jgi:hypothetical protein
MKWDCDFNQAGKEVTHHNEMCVKTVRLITAGLRANCQSTCIRETSSVWDKGAERVARFLKLFNGKQQPTDQVSIYATMFP